MAWADPPRFLGVRGVPRFPAPPINWVLIRDQMQIRDGINYIYLGSDQWVPQPALNRLANGKDQETIGLHPVGSRWCAEPIPDSSQPRQQRGDDAFSLALGE